MRPADGRPLQPGRDVVPDVTVVAPVHRNRDTVAELRRRVDASLASAGLRYELLFVDDACPEGSVDVLRELARAFPEVGVLALAHNRGQNAALLAGLREARGQRVVFLDADLQDPPEVIPRLLDGLASGAAAVFGGRRGAYQSWSRLVTSRAYKGLQRILSGVPADAGLFVALDRRMVERLLAESPPFLVPAMGLSRLPLTSLPVERSARPSGASSYSAWKRLVTGCRAALWVLARRLRGRAATNPAEVRERIGARFERG